MPIDPLISQSIIYGSLIALMCVGLTVQYLTTKVPNFAVGDFVITGTYATASAFIFWNIRSPYFATPVGFLLGGIAAVVMYVAVLRPLIRRGASLVMLMIATLAVDLIFTGVNLLFIEEASSLYGRILASRGYSFYTLYSLGDFKFFQEPGMLFVGPVTLVIVAVALYTLLNKTKFGIAMRASIENANLAKVVGINVERIYLVSWFIAGGVAGLAGGFFAILYTTTPNEAFILVIPIFAGSVLGGLSSIYGAIVGGFLIGTGEVYVTGGLVVLVNSLSKSSLGDQLINFELGIPLAIMIVVLLVAPVGLAALHWQKIFARLPRP